MPPRRATRRTAAETENNATNNAAVSRNEIAQIVADQIAAAIPNIVAQLTPNGNSGINGGTNGNDRTNGAADTNGTEGNNGTIGEHS
ncbi:hypothetical protein L1987_09053 [Smallanthus sonchifolius]|uniref:Uncharacterized protein n=3 Tax=Smallanthus sonchifolius TaxID=185202 RepID=A0ACB9JNY0_9ASTR|nr:hypothetical protein L1987_80318 [Smallanthus sonchifolius]KAI3811197.1 hypothetical protein L1987_20915 [Smallanthus sonchifolius]KAI3821485.1 hypothetical protein L1987_09053 [Smallanthus sonchifolius]